MLPTPMSPAAENFTPSYSKNQDKGADNTADPDPGSGAFFTPGSGMVKSQDPDPGSGSGMNNTDHISESLETIFW
jgi:hypothetical protein